MSVVIPYVDEPHPVTGVTNAKFGIWLFLASEVMLFGALFSTLIILRMGAASWPHGYEVLNVPLGTLNTIILITSSVTMVMSWASLKLDQFGKFRFYMGTTILLSLVFLVIKFFEYSAKFEHEHFPSTSTFYAIYFTMTGLHGLHIIGGIIVNSYLWVKARFQDVEDAAQPVCGACRSCGALLAFCRLGVDLLIPGIILIVMEAKWVPTALMKFASM